MDLSEQALGSRSVQTEEGLSPHSPSDLLSGKTLKKYFTSSPLNHRNLLESVSSSSYLPAVTATMTEVTQRFPAKRGCYRGTQPGLGS